MHLHIFIIIYILLYIYTLRFNDRTNILSNDDTKRMCYNSYNLISSQTFYWGIRKKMYRVCFLKVFNTIRIEDKNIVFKIHFQLFKITVFKKVFNTEESIWLLLFYYT